jgi:phosphatidylglycerol---prolipoprotein diacylglyceryl transferase
MQPIMMVWGGITVHWYGVLFASGFLAAAIHWSWMGRRMGFPGGFGVELCLWVVVASVVGARLAYVAANFSLFWENPVYVFRIDRGGLVYYGGFVGAVLAVILVAGIRRIPLWRLADLAIGPVPLGHALGRVGCLLNGCCYGAVTDGWWAVPLGEVRRYPVPLMEATLNLALYIVLLHFARTKHREGRVFALYLLIYPPIRFGLEYLRGDERLQGMFLNSAQEISILLFFIGWFLWISLPPTRHFARRHGTGT